MKEAKQLNFNNTSTERYLKPMQPITNIEMFTENVNEIFRIAYRGEKRFKLNFTPEEMKAFVEKTNIERSKLQHKLVTESDVNQRFEILKSRYKDFMLYFRGDPRTSLNLDKGLYVYGPPGSGKTLIMDIFKDYSGDYLKRNSFRKSTSSEIIISASKHGLEGLDKYIMTDSFKPICLYIEDFGAGEQSVKNFGTSVNPMTELISRRYRHFGTDGTLTHICSNIKPEDIKRHFDGRIYSRLNEMCNFVDLNILDFRKL